MQDARAFCQRFFPWYNAEQHHSGIALLTPEVLHYGQAEEVIRRRQEVLNGAYTRNPERFVRASPKPQPQPTAVWIDAPTLTPVTEEVRHYFTPAGVANSLTRSVPLGSNIVGLVFLLNCVGDSSVTDYITRLVGVC
jgi:hypothetical protein